MGIFSKKSKKLELPRLPPLPMDSVKTFSDDNNLPRYEEQLKDEDIIRPKLPDFKRQILPTKPEFPRFGERVVPHPIEEIRTTPHKESPIFVKIEKYQEAVKTIQQIKSKINDAEKVLQKINSIKNSEEAELLHWERELNDIKEKIVRVDHKLFEV